MEVPMRTHVQKWGNSLALRIPKPFAAEVGLWPDSPVDVSVAEGKLVVEPAAEPPLTLKQLLSKVNKRNLHREVDAGPAVGNEVW
jgi:antitoxin MazE